MMKCPDARRNLLEADPRELRGEGGGELALHLQACAACRSLADEVLEGEAGLGLALEAALPALDLETLLARAGGAGVDAGPLGGGAPVAKPLRPLPFPRRILRPSLAWIPVAAAAAAAALFLQTGPGLPGPSYTPVPSAPGLDVEAPQGRSVVVLDTADPDIKVVWLF